MCNRHTRARALTAALACASCATPGRVADMRCPRPRKEGVAPPGGPKPNIDTGGEFVVELAGRFWDDRSTPLAIGSLLCYRSISREGAHLMSLSRSCEV